MAHLHGAGQTASAACRPARSRRRRRPGIWNRLSDGLPPQTSKRFQQIPRGCRATSGNSAVIGHLISGMVWAMAGAATLAVGRADSACTCDLQKLTPIHSAMPMSSEAFPFVR